MDFNFLAATMGSVVGWLGGTLAEIAREKAGIIKSGVPVVSARQEPEAAAVLVERAAIAGSSVVPGICRGTT